MGAGSAVEFDSSLSAADSGDSASRFEAEAVDVDSRGGYGVRAG